VPVREATGLGTPVVSLLLKGFFVDKRGLGCAKQAKITGQAASSLNIVLVEQVCRMHRNPDSQEPDCFSTSTKYACCFELR
jgi:hypothetical protein